MLSDTLINIRQQRYTISLEFAIIRRQEQGVTKSQPKFNQPTNQLSRSFPYSRGSTVSWLWRITLKTNISHPSQVRHPYVPKICPLSGFYEASLLTLLKIFREKVSAPTLMVKQPKNNCLKLLGVS